jgi:hypothetical protein
VRNNTGGEGVGFGKFGSLGFVFWSFDDLGSFRGRGFVFFRMAQGECAKEKAGKKEARF